MSNPSQQHWKPELYDDKFAFVSELSKDLIALLRPQQGERVLDLGCGTGDLSVKIAEAGAAVTGMDLSAAMIEQARRKFNAPGLRFIVGNAESFSAPEPYDAVFSNAALHWMTDADAVVRHVAGALVSGGRFVAEFGGHGNVATIAGAIERTLAAECGIDAAARCPWYFPTVGKYAALLERHGFRVVYAAHFDRPVQLAGGEDGLRHWLDSFAEPYFAGIEPALQDRLYGLIAAAAAPELLRDGVWNADYKRLRISAVKL